MAKVRALSTEEIAYLRYSAEHYIRVKNNYLAEQQKGLDALYSGGA